MDYAAATCTNEKLGTPGFLLRPPSGPGLPASTRHPSDVAKQAATTTWNPAIKCRAQLEYNSAAAPTSSFGPPMERLGVTSECTPSVHPRSGKQRAGQPSAQPAEPFRMRDQEQRWDSRAGGQAGPPSTFIPSRASSSSAGDALSGGASGPIFAGGRHDSFHSMNKPGRMPDYLKVYTVPRDIQCEEGIIIEPIIQSLGIGDKQMEQRITDQMTNLYDFFKQLYDQDQEEIRTLQAQVAQRDMELRQMRRVNLTPTKEGQQQPAVTSLMSPARCRQRLESSPCKASGAKAAILPSHGGKQPVTLLLPPLLNPARPFYKWWANVHSLYHRHITLWLGILFALVFIIAIVLLAALLLGRSHQNITTAYSPYMPPGPSITATWPMGLSFKANMS
ncbi:hypothetical protein Agub_g60, partial [Astrephomene gubernaculifera]